MIAIDSKGDILASESFPNSASKDTSFPSYRIWDTDEIWEKMCIGSRKVASQVRKNGIVGVTVTTFGVDGTLFDKSGNMLYPVISWQCERTVPIMAAIDKYIPLTDLYRESGVLPFNFNTINKLIWFIENRPDLVEKSHCFLLCPLCLTCCLQGKWLMIYNGRYVDDDSPIHRQVLEYFQQNRFPIEKTGKLLNRGLLPVR